MQFFLLPLIQVCIPSFPWDRSLNARALLVCQAHARVHVLHEAGHRQVAAGSWSRAQLAVCVHHTPSHEHCVGRAVRHEALEQVAVHTRVVRRSVRGREQTHRLIPVSSICV